MHPRFVLLLACLAPGLGHAALGRWNRAFGFAAFTLFFAALTWKFAPHDRSLVGRTAAGLFVWALSLPDAYRTAAQRRHAVARESMTASPS